MHLVNVDGKNLTYCRVAPSWIAFSATPNCIISVLYLFVTIPANLNQQSVRYETEMGGNIHCKALLTFQPKPTSCVSARPKATPAKSGELEMMGTLQESLRKSTRRATQSRKNWLRSWRLFGIDKKYVLLLLVCPYLCNRGRYILQKSIGTWQRKEEEELFSSPTQTQRKLFSSPVVLSVRIRRTGSAIYIAPTALYWE